MENINESDWKYLSRLKSTLLERFCERILNEICVTAAPANKKNSFHQQYLEVDKLVCRLKETAAECFDDWKRSRFIEILLQLTRNKAINDSEMEGFSEKTRERVKKYIEFFG